MLCGTHFQMLLQGETNQQKQYKIISAFLLHPSWPTTLKWELLFAASSTSCVAHIHGSGEEQLRLIKLYCSTKKLLNCTHLSCLLCNRSQMTVFQRQQAGLLNHIAYSMSCSTLFIFTGLFPTGGHQGVSVYCSKQIEVKEDPTVTVVKTHLLWLVEPHVISALSSPWAEFQFLLKMLRRHA